MTVIVAGSLNMDLNIKVESHPRPGEEIAGDGFSYSPGGKALNQAVAAVRAGTRVRIVGWLGSDAYGRELLAFLEKESIDSSFIQLRADYPTPLSVVLVDSTSENIIIYDTKAHVQDRLGEHVPFSAGDVFLCQLGLPADSRRMMLAAARDNGALSILNAAPAPKDIQLKDDQVDILVVNERELHELTSTSADASLEHCVELTMPLRTTGTIATLGANGVLLHHDGSLLRIPAVQVRAVDTTGAGDAFLGALASQLALGRDLPQAAMYANKYAALSTTKRGAAVSMPVWSSVSG
jgi:ribokinase